jgi:Mg2+ and Co2+ transporter CorA
MPQATSTQHQPAAPFNVRLVDAAGCHSPATPSDVAGLVQAGTFAWLDLENPDDDQLRQFTDTVGLDPDTLRAGQHVPSRPSFTTTADVIQAYLPGADKRHGSGGSVLVSIVFTGRYLFTLHASPCPALQEARDRYASLHEDAKGDGPLVLFLVLDSLVGSFEPQVLALDQRLNDIQETLLNGSSPNLHDEIVRIRRTLSGAVRVLTWYGNDLDDFAGNVDQLPGTGPGSEAHFDRHRQRVRRMRDAAKDYREEAKDALAQYSSNTTNRQGQLINILTVVATLFLPLTFITSFFGMNFNVLTMDLRTNLIFILLGVALPAVSVVVTLLLYRRLTRRLGVGNLRQPPS